MSRYYGMDGQPLTLDEWAKRFVVRPETGEDPRRVARDHRGGITVSTVLLGLDHSFGSGPPLIFETMIFGGDHNEHQERYSTLAEAQDGHRRACDLAFGAKP